METIWTLAFLAQYGALVVAFGLVGALTVSAVYEIVQNKMFGDRVIGSASVQNAEGSAA
jgi:hypothetical protein